MRRTAAAPEQRPRYRPVFQIYSPATPGHATGPPTADAGGDQEEFLPDLSHADIRQSGGDVDLNLQAFAGVQTPRQHLPQVMSNTRFSGGGAAAEAYINGADEEWWRQYQTTEFRDEQQPPPAPFDDDTASFSFSFSSRAALRDLSLVYTHVWPNAVSYQEQVPCLGSQLIFSDYYNHALLSRTGATGARAVTVTQHNLRRFRQDMVAQRRRTELLSSTAGSDLEGGGGAAAPVREASAVNPSDDEAGYGLSELEEIAYQDPPYMDYSSRHGYTPTTSDMNINAGAGAGASTGCHSLGNSDDGGGGLELGDLESHGWSPTQPTSESGSGQARHAHGLSRCRHHVQNFLNMMMMMIIAGYVTVIEGGQAPVREPEEVARILREIFCQLYAALLAACIMSYAALKDAPDHVKFISFGGQGIITIALIIGMLSGPLAHRRLAFRLVSCVAVTLLTFSVASQLSGRTYTVLTAVAGVLLNLFIMWLRF